MSAQSRTRITATLSAEHRARLMGLAREVNFPAGTRLFNEGGRADRFWIVRSGIVALDVHVPGRQPAVVDRLDRDELLGWSWLFPPHLWHLGAEAQTPLRTYEFDAAAVRMAMDADPAFRADVSQWVGQVLARRLISARIRLLDRFAPYGSGSGL
ncbi:Crp/Fnr family transcriptional regulator [Streptomyces xanthochromogenes]|uniref:Crp/Fnr family transcriptional regulator n=1 Tax=Streptomyces xanthochromogenes TaxID=67384 RepID=UPI003800F72F